MGEAPHFPDADAAAMGLAPGSIDKLHRQMTKALMRFVVENRTAEADVMIAVVSTHLLDMMYGLIQQAGGTSSPEVFARYMAKTAGQIARGEHRPGSVQ